MCVCVCYYCIEITQKLTVSRIREKRRNMFLRPRHVSAAVVSSTAIAEDGKPASLASIEEEVGELLPPAAADTKRRQRSVLRQIRFRCQNLNLRLHLCGVTRSRRKAMLTLCGGWCLLSMCTVLLFALLRTMAMVSIVPSAGSTVDDGGQMFTVLVNTFERPRQLEEAVQHYAKCEGYVSRDTRCNYMSISFKLSVVPASSVLAATADARQVDKNCKKTPTGFASVNS